MNRCFPVEQPVWSSEDVFMQWADRNTAASLFAKPHTTKYRTTSHSYSNLHSVRKELAIKIDRICEEKRQHANLIRDFEKTQERIFQEANALSAKNGGSSSIETNLSIISNVIVLVIPAKEVSNPRDLASCITIKGKSYAILGYEPVSENLSEGEIQKITIEHYSGISSTGKTLLLRDAEIDPKGNILQYRSQEYIPTSEELVKIKKNTDAALARVASPEILSPQSSA